ncbi:hypothetical protein MASR2M15_19070 [Anaerolineales bacterium]
MTEESKRNSVFENDWRLCLQEQYMSVIRTEDHITKVSLTPLMLEMGFSESDLEMMYIKATMRADVMPEDYLPSISLAAHAAECACPDCVSIVDESLHDDEGQLLSPDEQAEKQEQLDYEARRQQDDQPSQDDEGESRSQLSLF